MSNASSADPTAADAPAGSNATIDAVVAAINATVDLLLTDGSEGDPAGAAGDAAADDPDADVLTYDAAPAPPAAADEGGVTLMIFVFVATAVFVTSVICVMRGTASMPRVCRKICLVVDR